MILIHLTESLDKNIQILKKALPIGKSFDLVAKEMKFGDTRAYWLGINGMYDDSVMQMILSDLQYSSFTEHMTIESIQDFLASKISFAQAQLSGNLDVILKNVVSGPSVIVIDGFAQAIIIDLRSYPTRSIMEPDTEKVMKGARDGFVETMLFNANLIRRRVRNPQLTFELNTIGKDSKTDVAIAFIDGLTDRKLLESVRDKLRGIRVNSLTMGTKSLEALLVKKRWFNPLPCIQTTERPDAACSYLMEGNILIIVDNSPSVIILPCTIFQFTQSPEDYYKSPLAGNFYRSLRFLCSLTSLYLLPVFLLLTGYFPDFSSKIQLMTTTIGPIKLLFFVFFAEMGLEVLKYASSHSLTSLTGPLSIVGGLIISEIAIKLNWVSLEIIFYAAVTLLTSLSVSSIEFADALRIYRLLLIVATGFFGLWGFIGGTLLIVISVITTPTFAGKSYFWPLVPLNWQALKTILFRQPTSKAQPENVWSRRKHKP